MTLELTLAAKKEAVSKDATMKLMVVLGQKTARLRKKTKEEEAALEKALVARKKKAAKKQTRLVDTSDAPNRNRLIKGNINRNGERIYHTPWSSPHYKRTKINTNKGERWFSTEGEATQAGWRAPYR